MMVRVSSSSIEASKMGSCQKERGGLLDCSTGLGSPYLVHTGQESRHIDEGKDGDVEGVDETDETGGLDRGVDVQASRQMRRVVGHHSHRVTLHTRQTDRDVL